MLCFASILLTACSTGHSVDRENLNEAFKAATGPLDDLNLRREEIPPYLTKVMKDPYAPPAKIQCAEIKTEVTQLDALVGPDARIMSDTALVAAESDDGLVASLEDLPNLPDRQTAIDNGVKTAHSGILGFIHDQTDILPFKSIIRKISGADRHAARVQQAVQAGQLRRAYLKGLAMAQFGPKCLAPPVVFEVNAAATKH